MTSAEIEVIYGELKQMFVRLEPEPERGLEYIKERLVFCRAMQDRLQELRLLVNREQSQLMETKLVAQHTHTVDPEAVTKADILAIERDLQRHTMLTRMIGLQASVLSRTSSDIKLLADMTKEQLKRGPVNPNEAPDIIKEVPIVEMARSVETAPLPSVTNTVPPDVAPPTVTASPFEPLVEVPASHAEVPAAWSPFVSIDGPSPVAEVTPMTLPESESKVVSLADLLEGMDGASAPRIF